MYGQSIRLVIWAIEAVVVKPAAKSAPSDAEVLVADMRHATCAKAADVSATKATDVSSAEAADVTSAKPTHMTSAKAAHVASATPAMSTTTTATTGLCARGKQAAGKHCACQNHHHSSSHDILHRKGGLSASGSRQTLSRPSKGHERRDGREMGMLIWRLD